jgi:hypothetical protein
MNRREALALIPAASLAAQPFLGASHYALLEQLCDVLIPSEPGSPGAREARVAWYIDTVLKYAPPATQQLWRTELARFAPVVTEAAVAREAADPASFFHATFKPLAVDAFCLSKEARLTLGYTGDRALDAFPGCTHPEHHGE